MLTCLGGHPRRLEISMNQRFLMWGLASIAFVVTLGISSWHEGLWASDEPATVHHTRPAAVANDDITPMPAQPFGPAKTAPAALPAIAAVTPQPPPPPAEAPPPSDPSEPMPNAVADMDEAVFMDHQDRAAQHASRAH